MARVPLTSAIESRTMSATLPKPTLGGMTSRSALIADDETLAQERLRSLPAGDGEVELIGNEAAG